MRISIIPLVLLGCIAFAQTDPVVDSPDGEPPPEKEDNTFKVFPDPLGKEYFPKKEASYYTRYLAAMKEPSVRVKPQKGVERVFRFTYLRSFHDPLVVRVTERDGILHARAVRLRMDREYRPVKVEHDKVNKLDAETAKTIQTFLKDEQVWKALDDEERIYAWGGLDGSRWIFELHDKDGYKKIDICGPDEIAHEIAEAKKGGADVSKVRDFDRFRTLGYKLLETCQIMPEPDARY